MSDRYGSRTAVTVPRQLESWRKNLVGPAIAPTTWRSKNNSSLRDVAYAMAAGLAVRLAAVMFLFTDRLDPWRGHWRFAWEMGMVGRSLATGKGFSSPFPPDTGPTAWLGPIYPALIAGVFKLFGLFTASSAIALLTLNSIFSILTCVPIFLIAQQTMGERQARWATWIWALFPYAIYISAGRIWDNALTTLLLTVIVWFTLVLEKRATPLLWANYGALWALSARTRQCQHVRAASAAGAVDRVAPHSPGRTLAGRRGSRGHRVCSTSRALASAELQHVRTFHSASQ